MNREIHITPFRELPLKDDFMFGEVMRDETICKLFLEELLGVSIERIVIIEKQKDFSDTFQWHSVRLDAYIQDGKGTIYNIEIQVKRVKKLSYRIVYYHSAMKREVLPKGSDYDEMSHTYVIFVCDYDDYGLGLAVNEWETRVKGTEYVVDTGTHTFVLNSRYKVPNAHPAIVEFLDYIRRGKELENPQSELVKRTQERVKAIRRDDKKEVSYMTWALRLRDERMEGREEKQNEIILKLLNKYKDTTKVADMLDIPVTDVQQVAEERKQK